MNVVYGCFPAIFVHVATNYTVICCSQRLNSGRFRQREEKSAWNATRTAYCPCLFRGTVHPACRYRRMNFRAQNCRTGMAQFSPTPPSVACPITRKLWVFDSSPASWSRTAADSYLRGPSVEFPVVKTSTVAQAHTTCMTGTCTHSSTKLTTPSWMIDICQEAPDTRVFWRLASVIFITAWTLGSCRSLQQDPFDIRREGSIVKNVAVSRLHGTSHFHSRTRHTKNKGTAFARVRPDNCYCKSRIAKGPCVKEAPFTVSSGRKTVSRC